MKSLTNQSPGPSQMNSSFSAGLAAFIAVALVISNADSAVLASRAVRQAANVRALWVTRSTLAAPGGIARMIEAAQSAGFNTLIVQVRGRGDAYYQSTLEPRAAELSDRPGVDPLAETLRLAHEAGLKVHAWVAVNLVSSAATLPRSRQHLVYRQPDWLMVPRQLAREMHGMDPRSPAYLRRLAEWTQSRTDDVEGLYASPIHPWTAKHVAAVVGGLVRNYEVDGVHLDYVRFPGEDFDYSRAALQQFKLAIRPQLSEPERQGADRQDRADPLAYPTLFPERWTTFRQDRLTTLVMTIRDAVKAARPDVILSAAVVPDIDRAAHSKLQDWRRWLDDSLIDAVCPMAYADTVVFEQQIRAAQLAAGRAPVWAGIGAYRLSSADTLAQIAAARRLNTAGIVLFSYDALVAPPNTASSLAELGRAAFGPGLR
jgi:uncharacterized lipoprotein YddW (UPF0748 family)